MDARFHFDKLFKFDRVLVGLLTIDELCTQQRSYNNDTRLLVLYRTPTNQLEDKTLSHVEIATWQESERESEKQKNS